MLLIKSREKVAAHKFFATSPQHLYGNFSIETVRGQSHWKFHQSDVTKAGKERNLKAQSVFDSSNSERRIIQLGNGWVDGKGITTKKHSWCSFDGITQNRSHSSWDLMSLYSVMFCSTAGLGLSPLRPRVILFLFATIFSQPRGNFFHAMIMKRRKIGFALKYATHLGLLWIYARRNLRGLSLPPTSADGKRSDTQHKIAFTPTTKGRLRLNSWWHIMLWAASMLYRVWVCVDFAINILCRRHRITSGLHI